MSAVHLRELSGAPGEQEWHKLVIAGLGAKTPAGSGAGK
jgi:hypothetical protein